MKRLSILLFAATITIMFAACKNDCYEVADNSKDLAKSHKMNEKSSDRSLYELNYYDSIGELHNELVVHLIDAISKLPETDDGKCLPIEENLLIDYCLQNGCEYLIDNHKISMNNQIYADWKIAKSNLEFSVIDYSSDPKLIMYWEKLIELSNSDNSLEQVNSEVSILLEQAYKDATYDLDISKQENQLLVALAVAKHSSSLWQTDATKKLTDVTRLTPMPQGGLKWWKADCIGAAIGYAGGGWIGSIVWGGMASLIAGIRELLRMHDPVIYNGGYMTESGYFYYIDDDNISFYNLFTPESQNPYLNGKYSLIQLPGNLSY